MTSLHFEEGNGNAIRWAVGSVSGPRSSTWRLWGNKKGDVYLSTRSLGGILKVSLHRDRNAHIGFTSEYAPVARERFGAQQSRHWAKWVLPSAPVAKAIQVAVPASELREFEEAKPARMKWLPTPPPGSLSVVTIFICEPGRSLELPPIDSGATPLGVIACATRRTWIVHMTHRVDEPTAEWIGMQRDKILELPGADSAPGGPGIRAVLYGVRGENDPYLMELAWD